MPVTVLFSYSHKDEGLRDQIETQLSLLKRQGVIEAWHDRRIGAGESFASVIDDHVEHDDIILLLVSPDYLASDYCYDREMTRAMQRQAKGEAIVIPVILRACDWQGAPFGRLNATPPDGRPITQYADRDQAMLEVAKAVRAAAGRLGASASKKPATTSQVTPAARAGTDFASPRSSNLALAKTFSDRDKERFKHDSFEYIARFFESSLDELVKRNPGIDGDFRRVDANHFTAVVYRDGRVVARCTVYLGDGGVSGGIAYSASEHSPRNSFNELLRVEADDQSLYLRSMGMAHVGHRSEDAKLTQEGAAELYWEILIGPLQPRR